MRSRLVVSAVLVGVLALVAPACSDGNPDASGSGKTSDTRPTSTTEPQSSDSTIPDLGSVGGAMGECMQVVATYTSLALGVVDGPEGARKSQKEAEQLKKKLPPELADDIDEVAATFGKIADKGILDGLGGLDDPAFTQANKNITDYLQKNCTGG